MFYETAQTVGPGWHRSFKPSHYEDMTWSPSSNKAFKSPDTSPQTYRRIIHMDDDFPKTSKDQADDDFFGGRRSPATTLPRRIFKEVWTEAPSGGGHRFGDSRPRLFKRVFKPGQWEEEFVDKDVPHVRRVERHFDDDRPLSRHHFDDDRPRSRHFDDERPLSRNFDEEFDRRFGGSRDFKKDLEEEFEKAEGRVHHIPIMVERRMEEMKSRFGKNDQDRRDIRDESEGDWEGPQVQNLRRAFEPDRASSKYSYRFPRSEPESRARSFTSPLSDSWDPHAIHTLPTRKVHKASQSFDDPRSSPKSVFRSYSETHEEKPRPHPPGQHSAAFRSHSDGHCPNQTYVTRVEITMPEKEDPRPEHRHCGQTRYPESDLKSGNDVGDSCGPARTEAASQCRDRGPEHKPETRKPESDLKSGSEANSTRTKDSASLQQIAAVLQNVEDLVVRVEAYSGTGRDKQYRFLDEMLTRCMLRLDDVDTEGREDVRGARKAALRRVQGCIDKLEAKAEESERRKQAGGASASERENGKQAESASAGEKESGKQAESANAGKKGSGKQAESANTDKEESQKQAVSANTNEIESASAEGKESGKQAETTSASEGEKSSEQTAGEECRIAVLVENPGKGVKESEEMESQEPEKEETKL